MTPKQACIDGIRRIVGTAASVDVSIYESANYTTEFALRVNNEVHGRLVRLCVICCVNMNVGIGVSE